MADPVGLCLSITTLVNQLYDYGSAVKAAQRDVTALCAELSALRSTFELLSTQDRAADQNNHGEFQSMLQSTELLLDGLSSKVGKKDTTLQRRMQSLKWPFNAGDIRETLLKLERLKSWFLLSFAVDDRRSSDSLHAQMKELADALRTDNLQRQHRDMTSVEASVRAALETVSPESAHRRACRSWQGTQSGLWFCDGPLKTWLGEKTPKRRIMLLTGKSGAGKTTLLSRAVECATQSAADDSLHVAYFYCAYNDADSQQARNVIGSWVSQVRPALDSITKSVRKVNEMTNRELESILAGVDASHSILLILDAINESSEARELAESLARMTTTSENIRCLVSTTPHTRAVKEAFTMPHLQIYMDAHLVVPDIEAYIRSEVRSNIVLSKVPESEFIDALVPKSEGMFRWIDCQMDFLRSQLTPRRVRNALKDLPGTLDDTYITLLGRVPEAGKQLVKEAFMWLSFCHRPLSLRERV
jgi:hypothetical protein